MKCMEQLNFADCKKALATKEMPVMIPGTRHFSMADYARPGAQIGKYRVTYVGKSFMKHFGTIEENNIPDSQLSVFTLKEWSLDPGVILGVGGPEAISANYLYHMIHLIQLGADGPGLFNGYTNLFYKESPLDGQLWSPHFYLRGDRLGFGALPACCEDGWEPGDRIFFLPV